MFVLLHLWFWNFDLFYVLCDVLFIALHHSFAMSNHNSFLTSNTLSRYTIMDVSKIIGHLKKYKSSKHNYWISRQQHFYVKMFTDIIKSMKEYNKKYTKINGLSDIVRFIFKTSWKPQKRSAQYAWCDILCEYDFNDYWKDINKYVIFSSKKIKNVSNTWTSDQSMYDICSMFVNIISFYYYIYLRYPTGFVVFITNTEIDYVLGEIHKESDNNNNDSNQSFSNNIESNTEVNNMNTILNEPINVNMNVNVDDLDGETTESDSDINLEAKFEDVLNETINTHSNGDNINSNIGDNISSNNNSRSNGNNNRSHIIRNRRRMSFDEWSRHISTIKDDNEFMNNVVNRSPTPIPLSNNISNINTSNNNFSNNNSNSINNNGKNNLSQSSQSSSNNSDSEFHINIPETHSPRRIYDFRVGTRSRRKRRRLSPILTPIFSDVDDTPFIQRVLGNINSNTSHNSNNNINVTSNNIVSPSNNSQNVQRRLQFNTNTTSNTTKKQSILKNDNDNNNNIKPKINKDIILSPDVYRMILKENEDTNKRLIAEIMELKACKKTLESAKECQICFDYMINLNHVIMLKCGHFYHIHCIKQWLQQPFQRKVCPLCRDRVYIWQYKHILNKKK